MYWDKLSTNHTCPLAGQVIVQKSMPPRGARWATATAGEIDKNGQRYGRYMKIVQINSTCGSGSTGKICVSVSKLLTETGIENYIFYTSGKSEYPLGRRYMHPWENKFQALKSRILGHFGFNSQVATKRLLHMLDEIQPDIIHLHNLHGHNCHLGMLFRYIKEKNIKVFWTFHDCWAFTGYCPHYDMAGCDQWKTGCRNCPQRRKFSWLFDRSHYLFEKKKELYGDLDMTIITPSQWLADQVKQSFLHKCDVKVIHNGIDLNVFQPRQSDFREKYHCQDKFVVLGVAFGWGVRKGLDVFVELSKRLDDRFQIILVGTDTNVDRLLPDNIISIHRTHDQVELAEIYTAADVFINPTREENYPTTHLEALACGTPVITFDTGGSKEMLDASCGVVVAKNDISSLARKIQEVCEKHPFTKEACIQRAKGFEAKNKFMEYIQLY